MLQTDVINGDYFQLQLFIFSRADVTLAQLVDHVCITIAGKNARTRHTFLMYFEKLIVWNSILNSQNFWGALNVLEQTTKIC